MNSLLLRQLSPSRLGRAAFLLRLLAWLAVAVLLTCLLGGVNAAPSGLTPVSATESIVTLIMIKVGALLLLAVGFIMTAVLPRLRDTDIPLIAVLVPLLLFPPVLFVLVVLLLFIPSGAFTSRRLV